MKILGMGMPELLIILVVILLIFGPKNLPKLGSALGKTVKGLRDGMSGSDEKGADADLAEEAEDDEEPERIEAEQKPAKKTVKAAKKADVTA